MIQFANLKNDNIGVYKNDILIFTHENRINIDYSLNKISEICDFNEEDIQVKTAEDFNTAEKNPDRLALDEQNNDELVVV